MDNYCTNCGHEILEGDKFCTNCGTKLQKEDKFCTNCGTKIDKSPIKQKSVLKAVQDSIEEKIAKENEEKKKKLKMIDEIFESKEIQSEIRKNNVNQKDVLSIKDLLKNKIIYKKENMSNAEIKYFIKTELKKARKKQENTRISTKKEKIRGGYCSLSCRHYYEEFLDSGGGIVGDFDSDGYVEYYCHLGHPISDGKFCKDYE